MRKTRTRIDRRDFFKAVGAAGLSSVLVTKEARAGSNESNAVNPNVRYKPPKPKYQQVPRRELGKTGVEVPCLSLGTNRIADNQIILRSALQHGITYWDTANSYMGGNTELCIGKFLSKSPELRKQLFIVTKASGIRQPPTAEAMTAQVEKCLQTSLQRMNTNYIDLYDGFHGLSEPSQLTDKLRQWAEDAKKRERIRFFGFSTHKNLVQNLTAAAKLGWVDVIMMAYNLRLMEDTELQAAINACHEAGIGLIAMKVIALDVRQRSQLEAGGKIDTEEDRRLMKHFLQRDLTVEQAKIKMVLADERISSACVGMTRGANLASNVKAVLDGTELTQADVAVLKEYARATRSDYCAGCAYICDSALPEAPYISDIMRYLMYCNSYGDKNGAKGLFAQIPSEVRSSLLKVDYSVAEARCPQALPIARLVTEAVSKLA